MEKFVPSLISLAGVIISGILAYIVSRNQSKATLKNLKIDYAKKATIKLFEKRLEIYPSLCSMVCTMANNIRANTEITIDDLIKLESELRNWDSQNSMYLSPLNIRCLWKLRHLLNGLIDTNNCSTQHLEDKLLPQLFQVEMALKTELGIFNATDHHNPNNVKSMNFYYSLLNVES